MIPFRRNGLKGQNTLLRKELELARATIDGLVGKRSPADDHVLEDDDLATGAEMLTVKQAPLDAWDYYADLFSSPVRARGVSLRRVNDPPRDNRIRAVEVRGVIDGDTFHAEVDLGFLEYTRQDCRLIGINCNELNQPGGPEAKEAVTTLLAEGPVTVESIKLDKFGGRFDAVVWVDTSEGALMVNDWLVAHGYAVPWNGRGTKPLVPWPPITPLAA